MPCQNCETGGCSTQGCIVRLDESYHKGSYCYRGYVGDAANVGAVASVSLFYVMYTSQAG